MTSRSQVTHRPLPAVGSTFARFVAGVARMTYSRYFLLDLAGGYPWIGSLTLASY